MKTLSGLVATMLLTACGTPSPQEASLSGLTVSHAVREIRDAVNDSIGSIDEAFGNNLFRARQHLELLLGRLDAIIGESTNHLFTELNETERQVFADAQRLVEDLEDLERVTANDVEEVVDRLSSSLAGLPFVEGLPLVFEARPLYVAAEPSSAVPSVQVTVEGVSLASGAPTLTVDGETCERNNLLATTLGFSCSGSHFLFDGESRAVVARLSVFKRRSFWDRVIFRQAERFEYEIPVTVIPESIGRVSVHVEASAPPIAEPRTQPFERKNPHCAGVSRPLIEFNAQEGWTIDQASIEVTCRSSVKSTCEGLSNVQSRSFGYRCVVENNGTCVWPFKDGRGNCWGSARWSEFKESPSESVKLPEFQLFWGRDKRIELPEDTKGVTIAVEKFNGEHVILTERETQDPWVTLEVPPGFREAILRPEPVTRAMGE